MPGPVSDSYDPEFSTGENCAEIREALDGVYERISTLLRQAPPLYILDLVRTPANNFTPAKVSATLTTKQWRLIRFALERAKDSI